MRKYSMVVAVFATCMEAVAQPGTISFTCMAIGHAGFGRTRRGAARQRRGDLRTRSSAEREAPSPDGRRRAYIHTRRCLSKRRSIGVPSMVDDCPLSEMYVLTRRTPTYGAYRPGAHGPPTYVIHDPHPHPHKAFSAHRLARPSWDIRIITTHLPHRTHGQEPQDPPPWRVSWNLH